MSVNQNSHKLNSVEFMTDFINLYRSLPALWKVKSSEYSNKFKKEEAYQKMVELAKTVCSNANVKFIKSKINTIRGSFRKELKKVLASKRSGASPDDIYVPKLWYYELLSFTFDQELPRQSTPSIPVKCEDTASVQGENDNESPELQDEDEPINTQMVNDESTFRVPERFPEVDFECPVLVKPDQNFYCNVTVLRGTDMMITLKFDEEDPKSYNVPDASISAFGEPIIEPSESVTYEVEYLSDVVFIHHSVMTVGEIMGFELFSIKSGNIEIEIWSPECSSSESYCGACQENCPDPGMVECSQDDSAFLPSAQRCIDDESTVTNQDSIKRVMKYSFPMTVSGKGYEYVDMWQEPERKKVQPGDVLSLRMEKDPLIAYRKPTPLESEMKMLDTNINGEFLEARHFLRVLVVTPMNVSILRSFSERGNHTVTLIATSGDVSDFQSTKEVIMVVEEPVSGISLNTDPSCVKVGEAASFQIEISNGTHLTLDWSCDNSEEKSTYIEYALDETEEESFTCTHQNNFTLTVKASNPWNYEEDSGMFCCLNSISRFWGIQTDSPQIAPPGFIEFSLRFEEDEKTFPNDASVVIDYGEQSELELYPITGIEAVVSAKHEYKSSGLYNITFNISNSVDFEIFVMEVELFEKMGPLEVTAMYSENSEMTDMKELHGAKKTDVPVNSVIQFTCKIDGTVYTYHMKVSDDRPESEASTKVFDAGFNEVGVFSATFQAKNPLESSNEATVELRIMAETSDLNLEASPTQILPGEDVAFIITFTSTDSFTCLSFDPGDGSVKQVFGNWDTCLEFYREEDMVYNENTIQEKRRKRETVNVNWVDSHTISILHTYEFSGTYGPKAESVNSIFTNKADATIEVTYPPATIWIENNSTNIKHPMKKFRKDNFRLETTAFLENVPSYRYEMVWNVFEITHSGSVIRTIDVDDIISHECSAIRFPSRYLDVGLYKVVYTIYITDNATEDENATYVDTPSCFTYLEIMSSPLEPMIFKGGDSYILRGLGQNVFLQPEIYSVDPNDLEDKNFEVKWQCRKMDRTKLGTVEDENLSGSVINRKNLDEADDQNGCFANTEQKSLLEGGDLIINTVDLWGTPELYYITMTITKDTRSARTWMFLDIIEEMPPGIIIRCEKHVTCRVTEGGFIVNSNNWLALRAECVSECGSGDLKYKWEIYGVEKPSFEPINLGDMTDFSVVDLDRFGVNETLFSEHEDIKEYHIKVTGSTNEGRPAGIAKLCIYINFPPIPGTCEIDTLSGTAVIDIFSLDFKGWTDPESHWLDDFGLYMRYKKSLYHIHYGEKKDAHFALPDGDIEIICAVTDLLGATTLLSAGIINVITPPQEELEIWKNSTNLLFFMAEGRMSLMAQEIAAEALVGLHLRKKYYDSIAATVDRIWGEYCSLPGIDSSYFTIQAREEIEAQVRDERDDEKCDLAKENQVQFEKVKLLPFEVLADAEVYGTAVSALAESRPLNRECKNILNDLLKNMYDSSVENEVPHPKDRCVANMIIGNSMNCLTKTISKERLGGNFLREELEKMFEFLKVNYTQPNFFFLYVNGSRWEVEERVHDFKVDGVKNVTQGEGEEQVHNMKNITDSMVDRIAQDVLVGENPLMVESTSGFYLNVEKRSVKELSGGTISDGQTAISLPSGCALVSAAPNCNPEEISIGVTAVKFTGVTNFLGAEKVNLNPNSNTLEFSLTNREGNETLDLKNSPEPLRICLPIQGPDFDEEPPTSHRKTGPSHIIPHFSRSSDFLVYHSLKLDSEEATVKVDLLPSVISAPLVLLYAVGFKPSLLARDGFILVKDLPQNDGIFTLLVDLNKFEVSAGDKFYLAVGHLAASIDVEKINTSTNFSRDDMTSDFSCNYTISIVTTGCFYFKEDDSSWSADGCHIESANGTMVCCLCDHLSSFATSFIIPPNSIDFSYVFSNYSFDDNLAIYLTLILTLVAYIFVVIWARWKDRKDLQKLGATPLPDNDVKDKYLYEIMVQTGYQLSAGTKSKVHFIVSGEDDETEVRTFGDAERAIFKSSAVDLFVLAVPRCLGQLTYLRIWHDNSGKGKHASWFVKFVVFKDVQTGFRYEFMIDRWLAVEEGDGLIDVLVPVAGKEQTNEFSHLFSSASRRNFSDNHLWFSVFLRPPRSRFTRVQRVSCCLAVLYLSMLASAMWYQTTTPKPTNSAFEFGPLSLSPEQITVGLMSNLVVFPPSFLMIMIFRKTRPRVLRPSHLDEALKQQRHQWQKEYGQTKEAESNAKKPGAPGEQKRRFSRGDEEAQLRYPKRKKKCTLPWWFVFVGWFLVIASVGCSLFFLWAYGLQFGNEKTSKWLTALVISFITSILLTEPIKIFFLALLVSCFCGNPELDEDDAMEDEEDPYLKNDEQWLHQIPQEANVRRPKYRPMDLKALELAREVRAKELKMQSVLKETSAYLVYLWILMVLSFGNRDPNSYFLRQTLINNFIKPGDLWNDFGTINNEIRFWNWTREALLPELFANLWYNGRIPLGLRLYTDDRCNFKIGYAVLRQVRAKPDSCNIPERMAHLITECSGFGNVIHEDGVFHGPLWHRDVSIEDVIPTEYKYMTAWDLNGYPFWGLVDWYGGGGYIVPLIAKRYEDCAALIQRMHELEQGGWIDKRTRAVFIEFGTYNAQVNLFVVVTILAEFLPGGGVVPYYHIDPIKLLHYHTGAGLLQLICQVGFLIFIVYYTITEIRSFIKLGMKYFKDYWNVAELSNLLASYAGIFVEIYKFCLTLRILRIFRETEGTGYIKLQEVLILDESFCYLIGFLMSLATLKFLKLLRFNKRIGSMFATLKLCAEELQGFGIALLIVFVAFVVLFWLVLGANVREFCSFVSSFESSISMLLKKFNYEDIEAASPVLGPLAFFTFALTASVILINLLLTIIIQSFEEVKHDSTLQGDDYELVPFMINRLKLMTGLGRPKVHSMPPLISEKKDNKKYDAIGDFPTKVDRLVDFINTVYFEEKIDFDNKEFLKKFRSNVSVDNSVDKRTETKKKQKSRPKRTSKYQSEEMKDYLDF